MKHDKREKKKLEDQIENLQYANIALKKELNRALNLIDAMSTKSTEQNAKIEALEVKVNAISEKPDVPKP